MPELLNQKQFETMVINICGYMLAAIIIGRANPEMKPDETETVVSKLTSSLAADIMTMDEKVVVDG